MLLELVIHQPGVFLERVVIPGADRVLELVNRLRTEEVEFAVRAPLVLAAHVERVAIDLPIRKRVPMAHRCFLGDDVERGALNAGGSPGEVLIDDRLREPNRFEDLRSAIALDGADAHLRDDLHHALDRRFDEVLAGRLVIDVLQHALADHVVDGLEREIRIHRAASVADQQREVMHFAGFPGLQHEANASA